MDLAAKNLQYFALKCQITNPALEDFHSAFSEC